MYARTTDLRLVQELLGHESPNTTAGYAAGSPEKAAAAVKGLEVERPRPRLAWWSTPEVAGAEPPVPLAR